MSFDKVPNNAVKGSGVEALGDAKASMSALIAAQSKAGAAEDNCLAALTDLNRDFKTALKDSETAARKYDAVIQHKATAEKANTVASTAMGTAKQTLSEARSAFLAAETGVERQANTGKAAAALTTKVQEKMALAQKALDRTQAELALQKADLTKIEKVLKKSPDDKRALKEKTEAEKEIKKGEAEVKQCGVALKKCSEDAAAVKSALGKTEAGLVAAKKALEEAGVKVDMALKQESAAKKALEEAAAGLAAAVKAEALMEAAAEEPSERVETIQVAMPLAKRALQDARTVAADASAAVQNRQDVEEMLTAILAKTANLLGQVRTKLGQLRALTPKAPPVEHRLTSLLAEAKLQDAVQSRLETASVKNELAGKAADLTDLIKALNSLADDTATLIKDEPGLRADHFKAELDAFYHDTIKANLKEHVKAEDVNLPKTLLAQQNAADGQGWSSDAIAKAQQVLTDKIKLRIAELHARGVELAGIVALEDDATYKNLYGRKFEIAQMVNKADMTIAKATAALDLLLAKQRRPSAGKWNAYLSKNGIKVGSSGAGPGYHITLMGNFISPNAGSIDLARDSNEQAISKLFKLNKEILEIHASQESSAAINTVHYYFSGTYVGAPSSGVKTALKGAMDKWLKDNIEPLINKAKGADGALEML